MKGSRKDGLIGHIRRHENLLILEYDRRKEEQRKTSFTICPANVQHMEDVACGSYVVFPRDSTGERIGLAVLI